MNITVSGIEGGVLKNVAVNIRPQMSMESLRKQVAVVDNPCELIYRRRFVLIVVLCR